MVFQRRNSNDSTVTTAGTKFKDNLIDEAGGESQFNFLIISFCERIHQDQFLKLFYGGLEMSNLVDLQKNMILSAILDVSAQETQAMRGKMILRHHLMFQQGFRAKHFDMLENHFADAMLEVWLEQGVMNLFTKHFKSLRSIFDDCKDFQLQAAIHEDKMMEQIISSVSSCALPEELQYTQ